MSDNAESGGKLAGIRRLILPSIAGLLVVYGLLSGGFGVVEIEPGEAAVIYNTTGLGIFGDEHRVIREQGTVTFIPWAQRVEIIDIQPTVLVMEGARDVDENHLKRLTVRANDGSNFWFKKLELHYQADPSQADKIIATHGRGDGYKHYAVRVHSREVLRDEFGGYSFLEAANPASYGHATTIAAKNLNKRLKRGGLRVSQVITPKPSFEQRVEQSITARQTAEQEVLVYAKQRLRLVKERDRKKQAIREKKNAEYQSLLARLAADLQRSRNKLVSVQREADKYAIARRAAANAHFVQRSTRAKAMAQAAKERAKGLAAKIRAVGERGPDVLNLEIANHIFPQLQKLSAAPYAKASRPIDIRHIEAGQPRRRAARKRAQSRPGGTR